MDITAQKQQVLTNARLATMAISDQPYGLIDDGAMAMANGRIKWLGAASELPEQYRDWPALDLAGRVVTPTLIDCHTHLVYGGNRAKEFEMRLEGASYTEIANAGGGIVSTVAATRAASEDTLLKAALPRVDQLIAEGVSSIEIKSGYGLDIETEARMLRVARQIEQLRTINIKTTYLGAHALPAEYADRADDYIDFVCQSALPRIHSEGLIDAVDAFCESIAFTREQTQRVFEAAHALGLPVKLHAEQLSNLRGAELAAQFNALSADHLEFLDQAGIDAMARAGTIAVLLPGAYYVLRETQLPPITELQQAGVGIALATDCNPGSSPVNSLLLIINMGCTLFRLTPEQALAGVTREGAKALGMQDDAGTLETGKRADCAIWDIQHPNELAYYVGYNPLHQRIIGGVAA